MNLQHAGRYNDLSKQFRDELENKVKGFGKTVRYKFDIANPNPDPQKTNGEFVYPTIYSLQPAVFTVRDPYENRENKQKTKEICLTDGLFTDTNNPSRFGKVKIHATQRGIYELDLEKNAEHFEIAMYLELHPKLKGGQFADDKQRQVVSRIDEKQAAATERLERIARKKATDLAAEMTDEQINQFALAMLWDETDEMEVLRNKVELAAETTPDLFNDLMEGKKVEYQAAVKKALNKKIIAFDPAEYKFTWTGNKQPIVILNNISGKGENEQLAEWLESGDKGKEVYNKIKELIKQ